MHLLHGPAGLRAAGELDEGDAAGLVGAPVPQQPDVLDVPEGREALPDQRLAGVLAQHHEDAAVGRLVQALGREADAAALLHGGAVEHCRLHRARQGNAAEPFPTRIQRPPLPFRSPPSAAAPRGPAVPARTEVGRRAFLLLFFTGKLNMQKSSPHPFHISRCSCQAEGRDDIWYFLHRSKPVVLKKVT